MVGMTSGDRESDRADPRSHFRPLPDPQNIKNAKNIVKILRNISISGGLYTTAMGEIEAVAPAKTSVSVARQSRLADSMHSNFIVRPKRII